MNRVYWILLGLLAPGFAGAQSASPSPSTTEPAPVLSPEEALARFRLDPGFRMELVAAEPLVSHPVALDIDPDGRLWVVEMPAYMKNVEGGGELEPIGRIAVLEDSDSDGRMDRRTVFLDGLVLPRAVKVVDGGALVGEPPNLWWCPDANADRVADSKVSLRNDYSLREAHPNYGPNGLTWAIDNWIHNVVYPVRLKREKGAWIFEPDLDRGQWGLSQDDQGRLFWNTSRDQLLADFVPAHYYTRNGNSRGWSGFAISMMREDQRVWPSHPTLGVSMVDTEGTLRPDGTLAKFTSACGPVVYRGDAFPAEYRGNAFVCEPAANLVRRVVLTDKGARVAASLPYEEREFLTSDDERFRPVNLHDSPDGCLYVVDMYKGIIEYKQQISPRLKEYIKARGLNETLVEFGRIYRVRPDGEIRRKGPALGAATTDALVAALGHDSGWWRDTAQQQLVAKGDAAVAPALRGLALEKRPAGESGVRACLHAIWTLEGLDALDDATLEKLFADPDARVRKQAVRACDERLRAGEGALLARVAKLTSDRDLAVRVQAAFSVGESPAPEAHTALLDAITRAAGERNVTDACLSGMRGRELETVLHLVRAGSWQQEKPDLTRTLRLLASCILEERDPQRLHALLEIIGGDGTAPQEWQRFGLFEGVVGPIPWVTNLPLMVAREPEKFLLLQEDPLPDLKRDVKKVLRILSWPGREDAPSAKWVAPLSGASLESHARGEKLYATTCAVCHNADGRGREKTAPPLSGSPWVRGKDAVPVRILLHGLSGEIVRNGTTWSSVMPPMGVFGDQEIADILTYVRRAWGNDGDPVEASTVTSTRQATADRKAPWTPGELDPLSR